MKRLNFLILIASSLIFGCSEDTSIVATDSTPATTAQIESHQAAHQTTLGLLADHTFRQTTELLHLSHQLHIAINELLTTPTHEALVFARQTYNTLLIEWVNSLPYITMTSLTSTGAPLVNRIEKLPILPGYIDQIPDYPFSGLVHDIMIPIEQDQLKLMHSLEKDEQVIFGLSAIEFLLFDHFEPNHHTRFINQTALSPEEHSEGITLEQLPNNRRRNLIATQADQLVKDLSELHNRWQPHKGEDAKRLTSLIDKNLTLTITRSYQKVTELMLDALNSIQEQPLILGRAHFAREEKAILLSGIGSLSKYHEKLSTIWSDFPQAEKEEFSAVLNSLIELIKQYQETPNNGLLLELASNRCTQLLEISEDLNFSDRNTDLDRITDLAPKP